MKHSFIRFVFALLLALTLPLSSFAADKLLNDGTRQRDMGDGTWAPVVSTVTGSGSAFTVQASVTRPANTTTYTANDVIGGSPTAVITFANIGAAGSNIAITGADLRVDIAAVPTGMTSFRLYLYNVTPASAYADNAAFDLGSGDRTGYQGYIDLGSPADLGSTLEAQVDQLYHQAQLASGSTTLYAYLVTVGGFAPAANSEVYNVTLRSVQP